MQKQELHVHADQLLSHLLDVVNAVASRINNGRAVNNGCFRQPTTTFST